jgi:hypothetical protein
MDVSTSSSFYFFGCLVGWDACFWIRDWASALFLCKMVEASLLFDFWLAVVFLAVHFGVGNVEI